MKPGPFSAFTWRRGEGSGPASPAEKQDPNLCCMLQNDELE